MTLFPGGKQKNLTKRRQGEKDERRAITPRPPRAHLRKRCSNYWGGDVLFMEAPVSYPAIHTPI